ncbi:hypothetical protein H5410_060695 [Solanum commersonii]|uniref:Ubiquitin-like domain-containing protein n=1 Tax=Solanum commersonii TaxID=4109 RepID=A0A9J5W664_SOLCO|nr:hypothetical protein H5410_060695 [Solanum commersonii]
MYSLNHSFCLVSGAGKPCKLMTKGVELTIIVKESDSIRHVKYLLHDKEGIPECLQQRFSTDVCLANKR